DQVEFLFINTREREANYKEKVKDFIDEKDYNFHVVYDKMEGSDALVSQYGIEGIPTKIIIDPSGRVRFQSAGGSSDVQAVVDEISYKIELIKELGEYLLGIAASCLTGGGGTFVVCFFLKRNASGIKV